MTLTLYTDWQSSTSDYTGALMSDGILYLSDGCVDATTSADWVVADYKTGQVLSIHPTNTTLIDTSKLYYSVSCANKNGSGNLIQITHDTLDSIMITPYKPFYYVIIVIGVYCIFNAIYKIFFKI